MKPVSPVLPHSDLPEVVYAKTQPQYLQLPAVNVGYADGWGSGTRSVVSRWKLNLRERLWVLITGDVWVELLTFRKPVQPQKLTVREPMWK